MQVQKLLVFTLYFGACHNRNPGGIADHTLDFLRHVIDLLQSHGVTVFFSSHLLYEIEPVVDHIAILDQGVIQKIGKTDELRDTVRKFVFTPQPAADLAKLTDVLDVTHAGEQVAVTVEHCDETKRAQIKAMSTNGVAETQLNLDEIFEAFVIGNKEAMVSV